MKRRGFSLIELLVVIASLTVIMGAAVCMLATLIRATGGGHEHQQRGESLDRLAEQFRRDAHAAIEVTKPEDPGDSAKITGFRFGPDHIVIYRVGESGFMTREDRDGDKRSEDLYAIPKNSIGSLAIDERNGNKFVRLVIVSPDEPQSMLGDIHIEAVLGRDHRFAVEAEERKTDEKNPDQ